jgi:hypothetical protein
VPPEADPIRAAIGEVLVAVCEVAPEGSAERKAALIEVMAAADRIQAALRPKPRMN